MTLDSFFNMTEMSNGLTAPSRVRELVALMQKGNDSIVKSFDDSSKQWSVVANALAATESKDCLDLFIELDGLHFLDKWLRDAHKFNNDPSDTLGEDSISHLLGALGKLHVDSEKLVASGIWNTVKDLTAHSNSGVQEKAREIFENWEKKTEVNAPISDIEKLEASTDVIERVNGGTENCVEDSSIPRETSIQEKSQESTSDCPVLATSADAANGAQVEIAHVMEKKLEATPIADDRPLDHVSSPPLANPAMDKVDSSDELKATIQIASPQEKVVSLEESKMSEDFTSCPDAINALKSVTEEKSEKISSAVDISSWAFGSSFASIKETDSKSAYSAEKEDDFMNHISKKSPSREKSVKNVKDSGTSLSDMEVGAKINKLNLRKSESHLVSSYSGRTDNADKVSDAALDYGILDPLEVARQVAMEVEREVGDYDDLSCSSSDKLPEGSLRKPVSPDSINEKKSHASQGSDNQVANDPDSSGEASEKMEDSATSTEKEDTNGKLDMEMDTPQVVEETQKEAKVEKVFAGFDLNEISPEDDDHLENHFTPPVSIVSASRAAANPGQPIGPLQFEGNLGWKGSAATSAFRPALNRRVYETEKDFSAGESSSSSKRRQVCLDFDLNMTDSVDDTHVVQNSSILSGESSMETNSRKSERVELDLNHVIMDNISSYAWKKEQSPFPFGNGQHQNLSHSSSPSSRHLFQTSNFDLNGQPSFPSESSDNSYLSKYNYQNPHLTSGVKSEEPSISLLGKRLYMKRKDPVAQPPPLQYGRSPDTAFDFNIGKSGNHLGVGSVLPYSHSPPVYGYNSIGPGPSPVPVPAMSFPSTMYGSTGPIPYMMDSRGAPIMPQLAGSGFPPTTAFSQPQFPMNMTNSIPANGFGSSRNTLDLSTGMMMMESGNGEPVGFRQFLNVGQVRSVDEQMMQNAQQAMNLFGGKRKEPENGFPYTQYMPPWQ